MTAVYCIALIIGSLFVICLYCCLIVGARADERMERMDADSR